MSWYSLSSDIVASLRLSALPALLGAYVGEAAIFAGEVPEDIDKTNAYIQVNAPFASNPFQFKNASKVGVELYVDITMWSPKENGVTVIDWGAYLIYIYFHRNSDLLGGIILEMSAPISVDSENFYGRTITMKIVIQED
jgi:uncharacterized protein involved in high-affinity Fe2+ transport